MRLPGVEPGSIAWKAIILTVGLQTLAEIQATTVFINKKYFDIKRFPKETNSETSRSQLCCWNIENMVQRHWRRSKKRGTMHQMDRLVKNPIKFMATKVFGLSFMFLSSLSTSSIFNSIPQSLTLRDPFLISISSYHFAKIKNSLC